MRGGCAIRTELLERPNEGRVVMVESVPEHVEVFEGTVDRRKLRRGNNVHPVAPARLQRLVDAIHSIAIGQCERLDPGGGGPFDDRSRCLERRRSTWSATAKSKVGRLSAVTASARRSWLRGVKIEMSGAYNRGAPAHQRARDARGDEESHAYGVPAVGRDHSVARERPPQGGARTAVTLLGHVAR